MDKMKHVLDLFLRAWRYWFPRPPQTPEGKTQTPEERRAFLRECDDAYLRHSGAGQCEWHGHFNGERTLCCVHHKILEKRKEEDAAHRATAEVSK